MATVEKTPVDLNEVNASFMEEYADVVRRLAIGDPVEREEVRRAMVSLGLPMRTLKADVDKLRRRFEAVEEIADIKSQREESERLNTEAAKLQKQLEDEHRKFAEAMRPRQERLRQLQERAARLATGSSIGAAVNSLRAGARPEIEAEILALRKEIHLARNDGQRLRQQIPRLKAMIEIAPIVREQFEEFRDTGRFFSRRDRQGQPIERNWAIGLAPGVPFDQLCIAKCEERVRRFDAAASNLAAIQQRIDVGIAREVQRLEAEIDRIAELQLDPMAMQFGVDAT